MKQVKIHRSMDNLNLLQVELILMTFEDIQTGLINEDQIQHAFDILPVKNSGMNNLARIRAINSYVIHNNQDLNDMRTTLINKQSDQNEVVEGPHALQAGVKPKRKTKVRKKSKTRAKGRGRAKK